MAFHLRCELRGHEQDVRGVLAGEFGIATSSRDKTIKTWVEQSANSYTMLSTLVGHADYAGPLAWLPPNQIPELPHGALVSGSRDSTIMLWDVTTGEALRTCKGHGFQVAAVDVLPTGDIASGSLDKTIRTWRASDGSQVSVLEGHEAPVLALVATPSGDIISGSGDTTVKVWSGGKCTATLRGHTDTVRALAVFPGLGFVSGSHDLTLRVWDMQGNIISTLLGHTAIIFCVAVLPSRSLIASGSEDCTTRLWKASGECMQVLQHPGCIWALTFTSAGDLVTGCSDGVARVWSEDPARTAPDDVLEALKSHLAQMKASEEQKQEEAPGLPAGLKVAELHTLLQPGGKDGETKVVKEANGAINAYAWDAKSFKWEMIGEVVAGPQQGTGNIKKMHLNQEWDFVFDVDIEDGAPVKKLPYNRDENPYIAADRFIEQEGMPAHFREQIVNFILQNSGQGAAAPDMGGSVTGGFCDPFTGSGSSGPSSSAAAAGTAGAGYQQGRLIHVPARVYMAFDTAPNPEGLGKKLLEFNQLVQQQQGPCMDEQETGAVLPGLLKKLPSAASSSGAGFSAAELGALTTKLLRWPREQLFPALDVGRMVALDAAAAAALAAQSGALASTLSSAAAEPAIAANQQLGLRLACNCFKHAPLRSWVTAARGELLDAFAPTCCTTNKGVRLSLATLLYNYAVYCKQSSPSDSETKLQVLSAVLELLGNCPLEDGDSVFRALVTLGTLCHEDSETCSLARDLGVQDVLKKVNESPEAKTPAGRRLLEAALDVMTLIMAS